MKKLLAVVFCLFFLIWIKPDAQVGDLKRGVIKCKSVEHGISAYSNKRWVTCKDLTGKTLQIHNDSIVYISKR